MGPITRLIRQVVKALRVLSCLIVCLSPVCRARQIQTSGTVPFILSGNRVYAQVAFVGPDGVSRITLVFVDLGSASMALSEKLFANLHVGSSRSVIFRVGGMDVPVAAGSVTTDPWFPFVIADGRTVEGLLPAGVLQRYQVRLDYALQTITLARPGTLRPDGTAVPIRVNEKTGLIVVDGVIDGTGYPMTIDNGSGYTWLRDTAARPWLSRHPDWRRGSGAVGLSNMRMADDGIEARGTLVRLPEINLGSLRIRDVEALAIPPNDSGRQFMDWYSTKTAVPVIGWLGGNVLRAYRITIDYPARVAYWYPETVLDPDLDYVGLVLRAERGEYYVAGIAVRDGVPTVEGAEIGDQVIRIGDLRTSGATREAVLQALHGGPGDLRTLILAREGRQIQLHARVTAF